jgi:hypothetical protein
MTALTLKRKGPSMTIPVYFTLNLLGAGQGKEAPGDWDFASRTIDSLVNQLLGYGHAPTIFASPESLRAHTPMLEEYLDRGCVIGLYVPSNQSVLLDGKRPMGVLPLADQERLITQAMAYFQQYMQYRPTVLRTGFYSGNEQTIQLCKKHHFTHTSIAMPGAQLSQLGTVWAEHSGHITTYDGITDIPVTTDSAERLFNRFPLHFSPEFGEREVYQRLITHAKSKGHVCLVTNNNTDYWSDASTARNNLYDILDMIAVDTELAPATIGSIHQN